MDKRERICSYENTIFIFLREPLELNVPDYAGFSASGSLAVPLFIVNPLAHFILSFIGLPCVLKMYTFSSTKKKKLILGP
jgi:hypothetical protein